jgi:hypothetical protein
MTKITVSWKTSTIRKDTWRHQAYSGASDCGMVTPMRRMEAILVIFVLAAMPVLLLTAGTDAGAEGCGRYCCPRRAALNSPMSHSTKAEKGAESMCHHGELGHMLECGMKSGHGMFEYTLIGPIPPTFLSPFATLAAPEISRQGFDRQDESATPGIMIIPFKPPRS